MSYLNSIPNPLAFVIDCLPNMSYDEVANNTIPLVDSIRSTHDNKDIPIILVESAIYGSEWWDSTMRYNQQKKRDTLRAQYDLLMAQQYTGIQYVEGSGIISPQEIAMCYSVDGTHPNDLVLTHSPNHLLTHSPNHLLTHSPDHLLTHSPNHLLTHQGMNKMFIYWHNYLNNMF